MNTSCSKGDPEPKEASRSNNQFRGNRKERGAHYTHCKGEVGPVYHVGYLQYQ